MKPILTIFTPTYNRENLLPRLYKSLTIQTFNKHFVWLIVDDGSTDNTKILVNNFMSEGKIQIKYIYQQNMGKASAHNKGVIFTETELFTCVDSDDSLNFNAVEIILTNWMVKRSKNIVGLLCFKQNFQNKQVSKLSNLTIQKATLQKAYRLYGLKGDTMLIYRTDIISLFSFPNYNGEKFVPEVLLYDQIDKMGELLIIRNYLYNCEYTTNGYTANITKLIQKNPTGYLVYLQRRIEKPISFKFLIMDLIRYSGLLIFLKDNTKYFRLKKKFFYFLFYPFSYLYSKYRFKNI